MLSNGPDGKVREVIIENLSNKKNRVTFFAHQLNSRAGLTPYLSVTVPYGSRSKRIELVFSTKQAMYLCKFTSADKADKAALDLQNLISSDSINLKTINIFGLVILDTNSSNFITRDFIKLVPNIKFTYEGDFMSELANGFSGESWTRI